MLRKNGHLVQESVFVFSFYVSSSSSSDMCCCNTGTGCVLPDNKQTIKCEKGTDFAQGVHTTITTTTCTCRLAGQTSGVGMYAWQHREIQWVGQEIFAVKTAKF